MKLVGENEYQKTDFIADLTEKVSKGLYGKDYPILDLFYLEKIEFSANGNGNKWQKVILSDITGKIEAKIWAENISIEYNDYEGCIVVISGKLTVYQGRPDISINAIKPYEGVCNLSEFIHALSDEEAQKMYEIIDSIDERGYFAKNTGLVRELFSQQNRRILSEMPLNDSGAFSYLGGLLNYTVQSLQRAYNMLRTQDQVNPLAINIGLVHAAVLLHKIGNLDVFDKKGVHYKKNANSHLLGSVASILKIYDTIACKRMEKRDVDELFHIIRVLHGECEPLTAEAKIAKSAVDTTMYLANYQHDFDMYDKKYLNNNTEVIDSGYRTIIRRKELKNGTDVKGTDQKTD